MAESLLELRVMPGEVKGTVLKTLCCECEAFVVNQGSDHLQLQCSSSPAPCFGSPTLPILVEKAFFICRIFIYWSAHRCAMCILHRTFRGDGGGGKGTAALPRIQCQPGVANPPRKHRFHHLFRAQPHPSWIFLLSDMLYNLVWQRFFYGFWFVAMKRHINKSRISFSNGLFNSCYNISLIFRARMRPNAHVSWQFVLGNLKKVSFLIRKPVNIFLYVSTYEVVEPAWLWGTK